MHLLSMVRRSKGTGCTCTLENISCSNRRPKYTVDEAGVGLELLMHGCRWLNLNYVVHDEVVVALGTPYPIKSHISIWNIGGSILRGRISGILVSILNRTSVVVSEGAAGDARVSFEELHFHALGLAELLFERRTVYGGYLLVYFGKLGLQIL